MKRDRKDILKLYQIVLVNSDYKIKVLNKYEDLEEELKKINLRKYSNEELVGLINSLKAQAIATGGERSELMKIVKTIEKRLKGRKTWNKK